MVYVKFTKPNHNPKYERTWSGIYHMMTFNNADAFGTKCGLTREIFECHTINMMDEPAKAGWLCKNCKRTKEK